MHDFDANDLYRVCHKDRKQYLAESHSNFIKKMGIDLIIKYYILLFNSIGHPKQSDVCFVDEVRNSNMNSNLATTRFEYGKRHPSRSLCFYKVYHGDHIKIGILSSAKLALIFIGQLSIALLRYRSNASFDEVVHYCLVRAFSKYLDCLESETKCFVLMTDHNFFSSIIAQNTKVKSCVIQHGLMQGLKYYYPIRADYFFAWGKGSAALLDFADNIIETGSFKFSSFKQTTKKDNYESILYCVSSLDEQAVIERIQATLNVAKRFSLTLRVKLHPGSMSKATAIVRALKKENIVFYKEEKLNQIPFDLAVTEDSTIVLDFACGGMPFIIFDEKDGYFRKYQELLPIVTTEEQLQDLMAHLNSFDFETIRERLVYEELNGGTCSIVEAITDIKNSRSPIRKEAQV